MHWLKSLLENHNVGNIHVLQLGINNLKKKSNSNEIYYLPILKTVIDRFLISETQLLKIVTDY